MIPIAVAVLFVVAVAAVGFAAGPAIMARPWWFHDPRPVVIQLFIASVGSVLSVVMAAAALVAVLPGPAHEKFEGLLDCLPAHWHPADMVGLAAVAALSAWVGVIAARVTARVVAVRSARRRYRADLELVADELPDCPDAVLVGHPAPVVYCLPAQRRGIVVTRGALSHLGPAELGAALAHERTHLRQRHHSLILLAEVLAIMLPALPTLRLARQAVPLLLEMVADDAAARTAGSETTADALDRLADAVSPPETLSAGGPSWARVRAERLRDPTTLARPRRGRPALISGLATLSAVAVPVGGPLAVVALIVAC